MMKKILICDDDRDILELCGHMLSKEYDVVTADRVDDVVNLVEQENPNLVLMDLWIPDVGGEAAVLKLRANAATESVPVVLFSANEEIEQITEKVKANGFIKKPFSVKKLKMYIADRLRA